MNVKERLVQEVYRDYTTSVNVKKTIQILLKYVPPEDLANLQSIVLTNMAALSRKRKRQRSSSGAPICDVLGRYHPGWKKQPAHIEIYVDNILEGASWDDLWFPPFRNWMFAKILYHEIGHHVQVISNVKLVKEEAFADNYADRLFTRFCQVRYWYLRSWAKPILWALKKSGLLKSKENAVK